MNSVTSMGRAAISLVDRDRLQFGSDAYSICAAIYNRVVLPGYTRADAAVYYYTINEKVSLQGDVENFLNKKYFVNADGNDNISPGYPRTTRLALRWRF